MNDKVKSGVAPKNPAAVALGRLGGKAGRGHVKARTSEQARAAVAVRWNKVKAQKKNQHDSQAARENLEQYLKEAQRQ